ncbi:MAG: glycosyltransferase family 39 protein [Desulfobacteraceae bacterium]|nr:MAG: glycosyltransferase family 39 protein [Desulfobacteraceae bacterium]
MKVKGKAVPHFRHPILWMPLFFILTYIILCTFVIIFPYELHDSDSVAYSYIAQNLALQPIIEWCAPEWYGHGGHVGLFQDHPPGVLWITAFFIRIGVPNTSAALCANFLYIFLSLYFIFLILSHFECSILGWSGVFAYVFTPIFLQYLIRANHEHALNLAVIAGIYGIVRCEESWKYKAFFVVSLIFAFLIKGLSAFILTALVLLYWLIFLRNKRTFLFIILAHLFAFGILYLFELWYLKITDGISFWHNYVAFQHGETARPGFNPFRMIYNFVWYLGRAIWFSAPWVIFLFYGIFKWKREFKSIIKNKFFKLSMINAVFIILLFSLFERKTDRYIFPAYTFLTLAGVWILYRFKPKIMQLLQKRKELLPIYLSAVLIVFTLLRIFFHTYFSRFVMFWPG